MQEEYGIKLKILTDNLKNNIMQVKGMIHNFKNDIKQDTEVNFTIDSNLTLKQLQKFKSDIESELAKLQESSKIGAGMKVVDPDEERKIKNLTAGLTMVKERIAEIGNEADDTKQKMSGISINANMTNNTIVNGFKDAWKSIKRFAFSLLSLRGIYGLVRKASSAYMAQDTGLAQQMQRTWASVGALVAPIIETIVKWIRIGAAYLNYFIKALTGKDLIGKAVKKINKYNKSLGGTAKAAKSVNKELTNMDEVTNLNFDDGNINNFSDGISNVGDAFDDFSDIKLDKNITKFLDDVAEKLKIVGNFLKPVIDWAKEHPGAVLTILGGAGLLKLLNKLTGGGVGSLGTLAKIGIVTAGVKLIYDYFSPNGKTFEENVKEAVDGLTDLNNTINDNTKTSNDNKKQNDKYLKTGQANADLLLSISQRRQSDNRTLYKQYTLTGFLTGANKKLSKQQKNNEKVTYDNLKALKKYYNQNKLNSEQIETFKNRLIDEIHWQEENYDVSKMNTEQAKKYREKLQFLKGTLEDITGHKYNPKIDINTEGFSIKTKGIQDVLNTFKNTTYKTKVEIDKQKEKDIKNQAKNIADSVKKALGIVVNPKVEMKVGTKDAKNKIANFLNTTHSAFSKLGVGSVTKTLMKQLLGAIPAYDVGTNYVPNDQLAMVHKGEAIIPKKFNNQQYFNSNNDETNALLVELNKNVIDLRNRANIFEIDGKELAQATYNYYENEGNRLNKSMTIKRSGN